MKLFKYLLCIFPLIIVINLVAQTPNPRPPRTTWNKELKYIQDGTMTFTNKTLTSPAIASPTFSGTATLKTGATTVFKVDSTGLLTVANGVNLGTSKSIVGTTGLTVGGGTETVAINSSDWDIDATGNMTGIGNITSNGTITDGTASLTAGAWTGITTLAMGGALSGVTTIGASGKATIGGDIETDDVVIADEVRVGHAVLDSVGRILVYVQNKNGGSLAEGDACVWDNTAVVVVADAPIADPAVIANDLSGEGGFMTLVVTTTGTADAGDSIRVYGWQYETGARDSVALLIPAEESVTFMINDTTTATLGLPIHWSHIDSVTFTADAVSDGATACVVNAYGVSTVKACDGANTDFAGVAVETIADNAYGYICVFGVCKATVDAATVDASPGVLLEGAANGDLVTDAAATTGQNVGRCLEYSTSDDKKILVFIDSF